MKYLYLSNIPKTVKLFLLVCILFFSSTAVSQSINNSISTGGLFTIKDNTNTFFSLSQSTGSLTLGKDLIFPSVTALSTYGVIYKGSEIFIHTYKASGTVGNNTFLGINSGNLVLRNSISQFSDMTASNNTSVGSNIMNLLTIGYSNSAFGTFSLFSDTSGGKNSAFGDSSLFGNLYSVDNSAFGVSSLRGNNPVTYQGYENTAFGYLSLFSVTNGSKNSAFGYRSMYSNTIGKENSSFGSSSLLNNTSGSYNSAFGESSLLLNSTGDSNSVFGSQSMVNNTTGYENSAFGYRSLFANTTGSLNNAFGTNAMRLNVTGSNNNAMGTNALYSNFSGSYNIALGYASLYSCVNGINNIAIGYNSGSNIISGSNNCTIGYNAFVPNGNLDNQMRMGNTDITYAYMPSSSYISSDLRLKHSIKDSDLGLQFITALRPVSYTRNNDISGKTEFGFIAQEVDELLKNTGVLNSGIINVDDNGIYSLRYNDLLAPTVKALQQLSEENKQLTEEITILKNKTMKVSDLLKRIEEMESELSNIESNVNAENVSRLEINNENK